MKRDRRGGFTLLEVIVATTLMGMAVVGLLALVNQSLGNAAAVREYDRAAMLARTRMDELLSMKPLPLNRQLSGRFDSLSGWEAIALPYEIPGGAPPGRTMLVRIALTVWWESRGERTEAELEGFRRIEIGEGGVLQRDPRSIF